MKIAIISDTHFGARNDNQMFVEYFRKFYTESFFPFLKTHGVKTIIHLGDLFDRRKYINYQVLNATRNFFFDKVSENGITMHLIVGNHDTYHKNTNRVNSLTEILGSRKDNFIIYTQPQCVMFEGKEFNFVPWMNQENSDEIKQFIATHKGILCGHFEIDGFEVIRGTRCQTETKQEMFSQYSRILSGHFHSKQSKENIIYVGAPYPITWSDHGEDRGFHLYETVTDTLDFIKNPFQMFIKFFYNDEKMKLVDVKRMDVSNCTGKYIKIFVVAKHNPLVFEKYIERIHESQPADVQVIEDSVTIMEQETGNSVDNEQDTVTILDKSVDTLSGNVSDVDKVQLKSILRQLYLEAISNQSTEETA